MLIKVFLNSVFDVYCNFDPNSSHYVHNKFVAYLYSGKRYGKEDDNWALDKCLKFTYFKRTNVQFFAHYFPPIQTPEKILQISQNLTQTAIYEYQGTRNEAVLMNMYAYVYVQFVSNLSII